VTDYPRLAGLRADATNRAGQLAELRRAAAELTAAIAALPRGDRARRLVLTRQLAAVNAALAGAVPGAATAEAAYQAALDALPGALDPRVPCLLLPVRLETRIRARTDGTAGDELLCRIYPDDLHADAHDPGLSDAETAAGEAYWRQVWGAGEAAAAAAWRALSARPSR